MALVSKAESIIMRVLEDEIQWAIDHPADNLSQDFQDGYKAGLQKAKYLIGEKGRFIFTEDNLRP